MRFFRITLALLVLLVAVSRNASAACDAGAPNLAFTDGRPLVYETAAVYGTPSCSAYEVIDVSYKALSGLPGTYLSWADADPSTQASCADSSLIGKVWDMTTSPPIYKGETRSTGVWVANREPASNPGASVCYLRPIRFESAFGLTAGRKYRFVVRASRLLQKAGRHFVFANAPLPTLNSGCDTLDGNFYCALLASSGASENYDRWPTTSYRLKLEPPNVKVAQGGDLLFQNGTFFQPHRGYQSNDAANFGYSNAALLYQGNVASLDAISCPDYKILTDIFATPQYTYLDEERNSTTAAGSGYCLLNARNNSIYKVRVEKTASNVIVVSNRFDRTTNRAAWGCLDGLCDPDARVASQFMRYTTNDRDAFVRRQFDLLHQSRYCIEGAFERLLPGPLSMSLHGEHLLASTSNSTSFGSASSLVNSVGFQGYHKAGTTRIENPADIRFEVHESTHAFNAKLFVSPLPSWLNEGLAIQTNRLSCDGNPDYLRDFWRSWTAGTTDQHAVGSEFFRRLETDYACDVDCAYGLWRALVDNLGTDPSITNFEIKQVMEIALGRSLTALFGTLGIPYPVGGP